MSLILRKSHNWFFYGKENKCFHPLRTTLYVSRHVTSLLRSLTVPCPFAGGNSLGYHLAAIGGTIAVLLVSRRPAHLTAPRQN